MARKDYTKFSNQTEAKITEQIETAIDDYEAEKHGVVSNCVRLNVREQPFEDAEVVCQIRCDDEVMIDEANSNTYFYKICTAAGIEGYCMRQYITIMP